MRGTLLNTVTVAVGATAGLLAGRTVPETYQTTALSGLGLVVVGLSVRMALKARNPLITAVSIAIGGILGLAIGVHSGLEAFAVAVRNQVGGGDAAAFARGAVTAFALFCVGPMTLLGCLEDGLEGKIELLSLKSTMDGIAAFFLAAASGPGVLLSAPLILLFQGGLTLAARPLKGLGKDQEALDEISGVGGAILLATSLGLMGIRDLHTANYIPAIVLAPLLVMVGRRWAQQKSPSSH